MDSVLFNELRYSQGLSEAQVQALLRLDRRKSSPSILPHFSHDIPVYGKDPSIYRNYVKKLIEQYANSDTSISEWISTEAGSVGFLTPQVGSTSGWAYRPPRAADYSPSPQAKIYLAACLRHYLSVAGTPQPEEVFKRFRMDKSHVGPTNSTGRRSFAYTVMRAMREGFEFYPLVSNFRHGVKESEFFQVLSFLSESIALTTAPLIRLVIMDALIQSILHRRYADASTYLKKPLGSGMLKADALFILGRLSVNEYLNICRNGQPEEFNVDFTLPLSEMDEMEALDYTTFDLFQGNRIITAATETMGSVVAELPLPTMRDLGFSENMDPLRWIELTHSLPLLAPAGISDPFPALLLEPMIDTIYSGQPDTASLGSACNCLILFDALALASSLGPDRLLEVLLSDLPVRKYWRSTVFSDDTMVSWKRSGDSPFPDLTPKLLLAAINALGYKIRREPLSFLRHHIIPGLGLVPQWTRRLARSLYPEYGYHDDMALAQISAVGKFVGLTKTEYKKVSLPQTLQEAAYSMKRFIYACNGLASLRDADEMVMLRALSAQVSTKAAQDMDSFRAQELYELTGEDVFQQDGNTFSLLDLLDPIKLEKLQHDRDLFSGSLIPPFLWKIGMVRQASFKYKVNTKL